MAEAGSMARETISEAAKSVKKVKAKKLKRLKQKAPSCQKQNLRKGKSRWDNEMDLDVRLFSIDTKEGPRACQRFYRPELLFDVKPSTAQCDSSLPNKLVKKNSQQSKINSHL